MIYTLMEINYLESESDILKKKILIFDLQVTLMRNISEPKVCFHSMLTGKLGQQKWEWEWEFIADILIYSQFKY